MPKSSIHIAPVKGGSESHNLREKELNYVRPELSNKNESLVSCSIEERMAEIRTKYEETTGQKMQSKATPIREGVVNMADHVTMADLNKLAERIEKEFGVKTFQIHIHEDEGHWDKSSGDWKPNRHAHVLMDFTDSNTGKSLKLDKFKMSEMQTVVADTLGMERGKSSDIKHLSAIEYKNAVQGEELQILRGEIKEVLQELSGVKQELAGVKNELEATRAENTELLKSSFAKGVAKLVGMDSDKTQIKQLQQDNEKLQIAYQSIMESFEETKQQLDDSVNRSEQLQQDYLNQFHETHRILLELQRLQSSKEIEAKYHEQRKTQLEEKNRQLRELKTAVYISHFQANPNPELKQKADSILAQVNQEFLHRERNPLIEKNNPSLKNDRGQGLSV